MGIDDAVQADPAPAARNAEPAPAARNAEPATNGTEGSYGTDPAALSVAIGAPSGGVPGISEFLGQAAAAGSVTRDAPVRDAPDRDALVPGGPAPGMARAGLAAPGLAEPGRPEPGLAAPGRPAPVPVASGLPQAEVLLSERARQCVQRTQESLDQALLVNVSDAVVHLARARALLDGALDEAMAESLVDGASLRSVAERAGIAPNTLPPRLGRTAVLGPYREPDDRVMLAGIVRARYELNLTRLATSLAAPIPDQQEGERCTPPTDIDDAGPLRFRRRGI